MSKERAYNFSAGPSMLPLSVIEDAAANLANYKGCGESVMEMSHRSAEFKAILEDAEKNLRDIMNIPDNYKVMFIQGGGTLQFAMVPLNLLRKSGKADYIITGTWAKKAAKEAQKFGDIKIVASSDLMLTTCISRSTILFMELTIRTSRIREISLSLQTCHRAYCQRRSM